MSPEEISGLGVGREAPFGVVGPLASGRPRGGNPEPIPENGSGGIDGGGHWDRFGSEKFLRLDDGEA